MRNGRSNLPILLPCITPFFYLLLCRHSETPATTKKRWKWKVTILIVHPFRQCFAYWWRWKKEQLAAVTSDFYNKKYFFLGLASSLHGSFVLCVSFFLLLLSPSDLYPLKFFDGVGCCLVFLRVLFRLPVEISLTARSNLKHQTRQKWTQIGKYEVNVCYALFLWHVFLLLVSPFFSSVSFFGYYLSLMFMSWCSVP